MLINVDSINVDVSITDEHDAPMSTMVGADEAARLLGVTKPTLYAYVSRGLVDRTIAVDGRRSLYPREQLERLALQRSGRRRPTERPTIDVQIASGVTALGDDAVRFRGRDAAELAATASFERVAELLWTGHLPDAEPVWPLDAQLLGRCLAAGDAAGPPDGISRLAIAATALAVGDDGQRPAAEVARQLLAIAPTVLGGPRRGDIATRLTKAYVRRPVPETVAAVGRCLVLLADHELATSTLGVRVAASVGCDPADALATGLHIVRGPLHGTAARLAAELLHEAADTGAATAISRRLATGARLPGFGHTVYRRGDPRFGALLDAVDEIPSDPERRALVHDVIAEAGRRIGPAPNVDLAVGALTYVAELPPDMPIFAVARVAGWAAHYDEERLERPVRFRGIATPRARRPVAGG